MDVSHFPWKLLLTVDGLKGGHSGAEIDKGRGNANRLLAVAFKGKMQKISLDLAECFQLDEFWYVLKVLHLDRMDYSRYILMAVILAAGLYLAMVGPNAAQRMEKARYRAGSAAVLAVLMVWSILTFSGVSTFLYFNF